jgi:Phosphotransferase enzyme family
MEGVVFVVATEAGPVVTRRCQITAAWLTATLRTAGHLPSGKVTTLAVEQWRGQAFSNLFQLRATYTRNVTAHASFMLKVARPAAASAAVNRRQWKEHQFYTQVAPVMDDPPIPRVFAAAYDPATDRSHVLLEDLSASHIRPPTPLPPTPDQLRGNVACLARFHAVWWVHPDLAGAMAERDDAWIEKRTLAARRRLSCFLTEYGGHLPSSTQSALKMTAASWPTILHRSTMAPLTVVHGDAHPWNFLTPVDPGEQRTCLLDWEGWSIEPGPHDLASLIALHLPVDERRALEEELLERYLLALRDHGVGDYDLLSCRDDYRRAVARRVLSPVGMWSRGTRTRSWWPALEHITAAFRDLRCHELL